MANPSTYDPDEFCKHVARCIDYQGIRTTARKLGWHPSKVSRARDSFCGLSLRDIVLLADAVHATIRFYIPDTSRLHRGPRGRPQQTPNPL